MPRLPSLRRLFLTPLYFYVCVISIYLSAYFLISLSGYIQMYSWNDDISTAKVSLACVHPKLQLWHPAIKELFNPPPPLSCSQEENWIYVKNGRCFISADAIHQHGEITCKYISKVRRGDFSVKNGKMKNVTFANGTTLISDFFEVVCKADGGTKYQNVHSGIMYNKTVHKRASSKALPKNAFGLDILIFALDGTSHMTWLRNLPKTHDYYVNKLGGIVLEGYNIVGDGTPQALLPILTGKTEDELPFARRGNKTAKPVDGHPWIWKNFTDIGYVTQFSEDEPGFGAFNYRMKGFSEQPTDHYMRPFYLEAEKKMYRLQKYCLGSISKYQNMLRWIKDFFEMYKNKRKFSFTFHGEYSHGELSRGTWADNDLKEFLVDMNNSGYLDNTLLILMSDHGARFEGIRETPQGKLEERMPYFSFRFPSWFHNKYPGIIKNLRTNVHRLTTPFDIHATLHDIINFTGDGLGDLNDRGISLFKEIPPERDCVHAEIEPHWCACLKWENVEITNSSVQEAASNLVQQINGFTMDNREQCVELSVESISSAVRYVPNDHVLKFKQSLDINGRIPDMSDNMTVSEVLYQIQVFTSPGHGFFEATMKHLVHENMFVVNEKEISRINKYGLQPHCVMHELPHLRPYCYCKYQLF